MEDREAAFGQFDHVRIYAADYGDRLKTYGFDVDVFRWSDDYDNFGGAKNRFGLIEEAPVFLARKNPN